MSVDGVAGVQARIQEIQQQFDSRLTSGGSSASSSSTSATSFADLLSAASDLSGATTSTSDGTDTSTGSSSSFVNLLSQALGGSSNTALGSSLDSSSLANAIQSLSSSTTSGTGATTATAAPPASGANQVFLQNALAQTGDAYVWGASASPTDPHPKAFDCSELVKWAAARAGVTVPDVAQNQYLWAKSHGTLIPVQQAINTPGALLFSFSSEPGPGNMYPAHAHVAISLGNGKTIEARGKAYGVGSFDAANRFNYAALVPGLTA